MKRPTHALMKEYAMMAFALVRIAPLAPSAKTCLEGMACAICTSTLQSSASMVAIAVRVPVMVLSVVQGACLLLSGLIPRNIKSFGKTLNRSSQKALKIARTQAC
mmetsp:Transcript_40907/g.98655  ORF Transcript_40907/g.98655 Transcript_40907/m.98655 type:complete len:105 (+) Transcript_40907:1984-2298(+)